jgi:hypothetical protein
LESQVEDTCRGHRNRRSKSSEEPGENETRDRHVVCGRHRHNEGEESSSVSLAGEYRNLAVGGHYRRDQGESYTLRRMEEWRDLASSGCRRRNGWDIR